MTKVVNNNYILVDYDNVDKISQRRGLKFIVDGIISRLEDTDLNNSKELMIRLYGGWYNSTSSTSLAQRLSTEIYRDFPNIFMNNKTKIIFKVNMELAYGLLITPKIHFYHTFRIRGYQSDIQAISPSSKGCSDSNCPVRIVYEFITNGKISNQCCSITPEDILYKGVQKLVDSMLSCDIFYLMENDYKSIVVVTSDDDFWPIMYFAVNHSKKIIHIHSKQNRSTKSIYKQSANSFYFEHLIWQII